MTAIAAIRRPDGLFLMADGAHYDGTGKLVKIAPKILLFPQASAALAARGSSLVAQGLLSLQIENIDSFDQLLEFLPIGLKVATDMAGAIAKLGMGGGRGEVIACGWSAERDQTEIWVIGNEPMKTRDTAGNIVDTPAYTAIKWEAPYLGQMPDEALCREFGFALPVDPSQFEPQATGLAWFQALRRHTAGPETEMEREYFGATEGLHLVGGYLQVATVYRTGVDSRIIHRWPDVVGEPITPR